MAVGHEWGWKKFDEPDLNNTGVWTISNAPFLGATNVSATAQSTAQKLGWWQPADGPFDFGRLLRRLARDHPLTKADLMLTLSDHACTKDDDPAGPPSPTPHLGRSCTQMGGITASSMVSDFTTDGRRRIAWHALTNPSMA
eukprot:gene36021-62024_t